MLQPLPRDRFGIRMQHPLFQQIADHIAKPACRMEMVHIGQPVRIDPRHQRRHIGQFREIFPVEHDPPGPRHRHQMDQQVG